MHAPVHDQRQASGTFASPTVSVRYSTVQSQMQIPMYNVNRTGFPKIPPLTAPLPRNIFLLTTVLATPLLLIPIYRRLRSSYLFFLSLGPGGIPYNIVGWLINVLVLEPAALSEEERRRPAAFGALIAAQAKCRPANAERTRDVLGLEQRRGERPEVSGCVPQRQLTQNAPEEMQQRMRELVDGVVAASAMRAASPEQADVLQRRSHYERRHMALYVSPLRLAEGRCGRIARRVQGEIGHVHTDGSSHWYFSSEDVKEVLEKGWGERHPLAGGDGEGIWGKVRSKLSGLGRGWVLVYGARDEKEFEVFERLADRSIGWMLGET